MRISDAISGLTLEDITKIVNAFTDFNIPIEAVKEVIELFPDQRDQYLSGKEQVLGFLIGQVMKKTSGKANPKMVNQILLEKLKENRRR